MDPAQPACHVDLVIAKSHVGDFAVGQNGTFTIVVTNAGDAPSSGEIVVTDNLPAGLGFVSASGDGWTFSVSGSALTARHAGPLDPGDKLGFGLTVSVGAAAVPQVTNVVRVSGGGDANTGNNEASDCVTVKNKLPDLSVTLTHKNSPCVGDTAKYRVTVRNKGYGPSAGPITVTDELPPGLTFVRGSGSGWTFSVTGGVVTATHSGPLAAGASLEFYLYLAVGPEAYPSVENTVEVSSPDDKNPANDRDSDRQSICAEPDLTIDKRHTEDFWVGEPGQYTFVVRNVGLAPATGTITVRDTLPAGLTYVGAAGTGWTIRATGAFVTATHPGPLAGGDSLKFTVTVAVGEEALPEVVNSAEVSSNCDPRGENDRDTDITPVRIRRPDLTVGMAVLNAPCIGDTARFRVTVGNVGERATTGTIVVRDSLPEGLAFAAGFGPGWTINVNNGIVTATHEGPLAIGDSLLLELHFVVGQQAYPSVTNSVTVSGGGQARTSNDFASVTVPVCSRPDLAVDKRHVGEFTVGANGQYAIVVRNVGDAATTGTITVRDTLPAGLTFVSGSGAGWTIGNIGAVVTATHAGPLAVGDSLQFGLVVAVGEAARPSVTNSATVSTPGDTNPTNDRDSDTVPVTVAAAPDLGIDKRHVGEFTVGVNGQYAIVVRNVGDAAATGTITVRDTLPAGLTFVSGSGAGWTIANIGAVVTATHAGPLAVGDSLQFGLVVAVGEAARPSVTNTATVSTPGDTNPTNDRDSDTVPVAVATAPDLGIDKRHIGEFIVGGNGQYAIVVRNVGDATTTGTITVRDTLPAGLLFVSANGAGWTISNIGAVVTATHAGPLAVGDSLALTLTVAVGELGYPAVANFASVGTPGDTNPTNDRDGDDATIARRGRLEILKQALQTDIEVGDVVDFRISITNTGETPFHDVVVRDDLPTGMRYVPGSARLEGSRLPDPQGANTRTLLFAIGTVPPRATLSLRYRVEVRATAAPGEAVNVAVASTPDDSTTTPVTPGTTSNVARAMVRVRPGPFTNEGMILGKVFLDCDCDSNGVQGPEELGIPGVRLVLEDGTSVVTDSEGKYSIPHLRPRLHVLRADTRTLPGGVRLTPVSNRNALDGESRFVDLKRGELHRADFRARDCSAVPLAAVKERRRTGEVEGAFVEGLVPFMAEAPPAAPLAPLALSPSRSLVPGDGISVLPVRVRRGGDAGPMQVTLESTVGRWTVTDEDPAVPGTQLMLSGEESVVGLRAPETPAIGMVRVTSGDRQDSLRVRFGPRPGSLFVNGLLEGRVDWRSLRDGELCGSCREDFEDRLVDASFDREDGRLHGAARGALYARGPVGPDMQFTVRYDTERDPDLRRFRDIRPLEGYDVYGDASVREFDARSTSRFYGRLERGASYAMFGDFVTPADPLRQLGAYTRSLNGAIAHVATPLVSTHLYGTQAREHQVVDELPGQGVSGPYALSRPDGVLGTEVVEILVRDRNQPSRVLRRESRMRFTDYTLEPFTGRLLFRQPVPSVDRDLNPVSIRVIYEVESTAAGYGIYGGDLTLTPSRRIALGVSASRDEDPIRSRGLASGHVRFAPADGLALVAEVAHSDSAGELFDGAGKAEAWRGDIRYERASLLGRVYAQRVDRGFDGSSSGILAGREELGADARIGLGATSLFARALRTEDLVTEGRRDGAEGGLAQRFGPWTAEAAYRWAEETSTPATTTSTGTTPNDVSAVRGRVGADLPWKRHASVFAEYVQDLEDDRASGWSLGGDVQAAPRTRLYLRHEELPSFAGPFALDGRRDQASTVIGLASDELRDGYVFSEYRARDAFGGRETQAAMGLRNRWHVSRGLRLDGSLEHLEVLRGGSGSATAVTGGLEYTRDPLWKGTGRLEFRTQSSVESWLGTVGLSRKLSRDWTALARSTWYATPDQERVDERSQIGLAWRQTDRNRWDALARYENVYEEDGASADPFRRVAHVVAGDFNWHPALAWTLGGQAAAKWRTDERGGVRVATDAQLFGARVLVDLTPRFDLGLVGRGLFSDHFDAARTGLGAEVGAVLARDLRLGIGYNVFGFRDDDLAGAECTDRGAYVRLGLKFGERLFGRREAGATSAAAPTAAAQRAVTTAPAGDDRPLTPLRRRTSDEVIANDLARIDAQQARLAALPPGRDAWREAAAGAWLDAAETEYTDNDETGFAAAAYARGAELVGQLASGAAPFSHLDVPAARILDGSSVIQPDAWNRLEGLKHDPGFACAAGDLARLEVELARAGNEALDQEECSTEPRVDEARRLARDAERKLAECRPAPVVAPPVAPVAPVVPVAPAEPELPDASVEIPRDVHFAFDRCDLSAASREVIDRVASVMRLYPKTRLRLEGHTDPRGTSAYNLGLARCRLCSVLAAFEERGILSSRLESEERGEEKLLTSERSRTGHARNRRVEMVLLGPDGAELRARTQEGDLQLEPVWDPSRTPRPASPAFPSHRAGMCGR